MDEPTMRQPSEKISVWFVTSFLDHPNGGMGRYEVRVSDGLRSNSAMDVTIVRLKPINLKSLEWIPWIGPRLVAVARNNPAWIELPPRTKGAVVVHLANQFMALAIPLIKLRCWVRRQRIRIVTTVHDLYDWDLVTNNELRDLYVPIPISTLAMRFLTLKGLGYSDWIIVDSVTMISTVTRYHPHLTKRISVAHPGWSEEVTSSENEVSPPHEREQTQILYVGSQHPRKNLVSLVGAFARLREIDKTVELVLAGATRSGSHHDDFTACEGVSVLGELPYSEIIRLYKTATILACPSRFEGFGLPVLEAMGYGCPVVASDTPVFREVAEDAAAFVPPLDVLQWAEVLKRLLNSPQERDAMAQRGRQRATDMSWRHTLDGTIRAYTAALGKGDGIRPEGRGEGAVNLVGSASVDL